MPKVRRDGREGKGTGKGPGSSDSSPRLGSGTAAGIMDKRWVTGYVRTGNRGGKHGLCCFMLMPFLKSLRLDTTECLQCGSPVFVNPSRTTSELWQCN